MLYDICLTIEFSRLNYTAVKSYQDQSTSRNIRKHNWSNFIVF